MSMGALNLGSCHTMIVPSRVCTVHMFFLTEFQQFFDEDKCGVGSWLHFYIKAF